MVDLTCQRFFTQPKHPLQRQYDALRSIFVGQRSQKEVAEEFGYQYDSLRQLVSEFRRTCQTLDDKSTSPFFDTPVPDGPKQKRTQIHSHRSPTDES